MRTVEDVVERAGIWYTWHTNTPKPVIHIKDSFACKIFKTLRVTTFSTTLTTPHDTINRGLLELVERFLH